MGSAAARHLTSETRSVALIGPNDALDFATHDGAWSGWADESRAWARIDVPLLSGIISVRAGRRFAALEEQTGISFTTPNPQLTLASVSSLSQPARSDGLEDVQQDYYNPTLLMQRASDLGVAAEYLDSVALAERFPRLRLPAGHYGVLQPDSRIINPRRLVAAQRTAACAAGAVHIVDEVVTVQRRNGIFDLHTADGTVVRSAQVILAAGVYNNLAGLSPRPLDMMVLGFTIGLTEVVAQADRFPTLLCMIESDSHPYGGIIAPPMPYPDGRWRIKSSGPCMVALNDLDETKQWVRSGGDPAEADIIRGVIEELLPDVHVLSSAVRPCLVSINAKVGHPYIGTIDDGLTVLTEGENGVSMSDEAGRLAARLVLDGKWTDSLPAEPFVPRFR
jgi:sarcosine oxidase